MARAPFQVIVFPYRFTPAGVEYVLFRRIDNDSWQGIAGGGEDYESPTQAATREAIEEAGIPKDCRLIELDSKSSIPVTALAASALWSDEIYVIPEYAFGIDVQGFEIGLSSAHCEHIWVTHEEANWHLVSEGNKTALWELNQKVLGLGPHENALR